MKEKGIYQIRRLDKPEQRYIGSSVNLRARKRQHFGDLRRGKHKNVRLQRIHDKYGEANLVFEVIEITDVDATRLRQIEKDYISATLDEVGSENIINMSMNTVCALDDPFVRDKKREAMRLLWEDSSYVERVTKSFVAIRYTDSFVNNHLIATRAAHQDKDLEAKRIKAIKDWYACDENRLRSVERMKEQSNQPERIEKSREVGKRLFSDPAFVEKIIKASKEAVSRAVTCLETGEVFISISDAARHLRQIGVEKAYNSPISACCRGKLKSAYGYHWHYSNEEYDHDRQKPTERGRRILCVEMNREFYSVMEAARFLRKTYNISADNSRISKKAKVQGKAYGYTWVYTDELDKL